jgi:hypothetical protein
LARLRNLMLPNPMTRVPETNKAGATAFDRRFVLPALGEAPEWWSSLLSLWRPAGTVINGDDPGLRLAVRKGYLNFYRRGQSVAKVTWSRGALRGEVHVAYIPQWAARAGPAARPYAILENDSLRFENETVPYGGLVQLHDWIGSIDAGRPNGRPYCGPEKTFVDLLVGANETVIDLEMGLPRVPQKRDGKAVFKDGKQVFVAPRMDLVMLETREQAEDCLVFWEAKMMTNGELRRREGAPQVTEQLMTYSEWIGELGNAVAVERAFRKACRCLLDLHVDARKVNTAIGPLGKRVIAFGQGEASPTGRVVDPKPRVVILDDRRSDSWERDGHSGKLTESGTFVRVVPHERTDPAELKL